MRLRRPLRMDFQGAYARAVPCVGGSDPISVCAGPWEENSGTALRGSRWSLAPEEASSQGFEGFLGARWKFLGLSGTAREGDGIQAQSGGIQAGANPARILFGVGRSHRWSNLLVSSSSGSIDLPWNDVTDSVFTGLALPVGPVECTTSLWKTDRRAVADTGLADTGSSLGWRVATSLETAFGAWTFSMEREDRFLSTTGRFQRKVFLEQEFSSARAQARVGWSGGNWQVQAGTRQYRLDSPQNDLDHPTLTWNNLSKQRFAAVYAVATDQQDYFSGNLTLQRWDCGFLHSWNGSAWSARAGLAGSLWTCRAEVLRRRLLVVGLLLSESLDSLASGNGWLATAGPEASISWRSERFGRVVLSASCAAPLAGDWNDHLAGPKAASGGSNPSLPLDPWSLWSVRVSWSQ
jgi:hypothetical protein